MTPTTKKTAPAGATAAAANENLSKDSIPTLYMLKPLQHTRHTFGTWSGVELPKEDYMQVGVHIAAFGKALLNGTLVFQPSEACIDAHDEEVRRRKSSEAAVEARRWEEANRRLEEKELIKKITGMDLVRDDLVVFMTQARRDGEDFQPFLDALQAIDDLDLSRAGMTSWGDFSDDEEGGDDV